MNRLRRARAGWKACPLWISLLLAACHSGNHNDASAVAQTPETADAQIARGRYLATTADCAACHTTKDGAPFAGGVKLQTPFGAIYGTNITPDKTHGIGAWSSDDFYTALHDGVAKGKTLYPAMPYTSYRQLSRADTDAIYAYLMAQKPAAVANHATELSFPYNLRPGLRVWKNLFLEDTLPDASSGHSDVWMRGRYLANALGHCQECHTPRGKLGQLLVAEPLKGATLGRIAAPDITPQGLAARGWTTADLQRFLTKGVSVQGSAFGEMYPVVHLSTQYLTDNDARAMTTYLLGDQIPTPEPVRSIDGNSPALQEGSDLYVSLCSGCHGRDGEGKPHVAVSMRSNSTVRQKDPHNLIVTLLDGIDEQGFPGLERMQAMPAFAGTLSDEQLAQLTRYLRTTWGGHPADVTAQDVRSLRQDSPMHD